MRVMVFVKATAETEAGVLPSEEDFAAMGRFNEELTAAGVLLAGEGLQPSAKGARVRFQGERRTVTHGPFTGTQDLVAGYWLWRVASMEEAIEWAKRAPNPTGYEGEIEIRPVYEAEDLTAASTSAP